MKKILLLFSIIIAVAILLLLAKPILFHYHIEDKSFNSSLWQSTGSNVGTYSHRQLMLKDLIKNVLPQKRWNHIELMLGKGETNNHFLELKPGALYLLGKQRALIPTCHEWLLIFYDSNGIFSHSKVICR